MLAIAGAGLVGLVKMRGEVSSIYDHEPNPSRLPSTLGAGRVDADLAAAGPALADLRLEQRAPLERVARGWADFKDLWGTQGLVPSSADLAARGQISAKLAAVFTP